MNGVLTSKSILWSGSGNTWEDGSLWFWRHSPLKGAHSTYQSNQILGNNGARCALRNTLRIEMSFYEGIKAFLWTYLEPLPLVIWFCCQHFHTSMATFPSTTYERERSCAFITEYMRLHGGKSKEWINWKIHLNSKWVSWKMVSKKECGGKMSAHRIQMVKITLKYDFGDETERSWLVPGQLVHKRTGLCGGHAVG